MSTPDSTGPTLRASATLHSSMKSSSMYSSRITTPYMGLQQSINFRVIEEFQKAGIEFAYPTQQLYVTTNEPV